MNKNRNYKNRCTSLTNNNKRCKNKIYEKNLCYNHFRQFISKFNFNIKNEVEYEDKIHFFIKYLIIINQVKKIETFYSNFVKRKILIKKFILKINQKRILNAYKKYYEKKCIASNKIKNFLLLNISNKVYGICSVCTEDITYNELNCKRHKIIKLDCGHILHLDCILNWNSIQLRCPYCRQKINTEDYSIYNVLLGGVGYKDFSEYCIISAPKYIYDLSKFLDNYLKSNALKKLIKNNKYINEIISKYFENYKINLFIKFFIMSVKKQKKNINQIGFCSESFFLINDNSLDRELVLKVSNIKNPEKYIGTYYYDRVIYKFYDNENIQFSIFNI